MSAEIYSNGRGEYSLEQLPDFYALDPDELDSNVEVHTFASRRDADFFLEGVEATRRLELDMTATRPVAIDDGRFGIVLTWSQGEGGVSQFNH
jgi:hypothetical protein